MRRMLHAMPCPMTLLSPSTCMHGVAHRRCEAWLSPPTTTTLPCTPSPPCSVRNALVIKSTWGGRFNINPNLTAGANYYLLKGQAPALLSRAASPLAVIVQVRRMTVAMAAQR